MPPDGHRSEGTPSFSEVPYAWGEPFFAYFFLAFEKKVSRRKGETLSGRYRSNEYVHLQKMGRRSDRHRRQASSHRNEYSRVNRVGCQTAIASRLTPTRGSGTDPRAWEPRKPTRHDKTGNGLDMKSLIRDRNQRSAGSLSCTPLHAIDSCAASIGKGGSSARNAHPSTNAHAA